LMDTRDRDRPFISERVRSAVILTSFERVLIRHTRHKVVDIALC
jgi:hypothetical protein